VYRAAKIPFFSERKPLACQFVAPLPVGKQFVLTLRCLKQCEK
jgi:hypothetical protein